MSSLPGAGWGFHQGRDHCSLGTGAECSLNRERKSPPWAYLAENKEGADVPEAGLLLQEGFQVDALKGLEAADQGDKGLVLRIVRDAVQEGHHGGQAGARSQHEKLTILGNRRGIDRKGWGGGGVSPHPPTSGLFLGLPEPEGPALPSAHPSE